jgi:hypothetical protein
MVVVNEDWNGDINHAEPYQLLFHKLTKMGRRLKIWSKSIFSKAKVELHMVFEIILQLDMAQENRPIIYEERDFRKILNRRVIGLATLEIIRKLQAQKPV